MKRISILNSVKMTKTNKQMLSSLTRAIAAEGKLSRSKANVAKLKSKKSKTSNSTLVPVSAAYASLQRFPYKGNAKNGSRRVVNKELVSTINGSVTFVANKFVINPGMAATFPWLSREATQWEQYRFNRICFHYITRTGSTTTGSVILSPLYDPKDPPPTSEVQATDTQDAVEDATWKDISCPLDTKALFEIGPRKFVRTGNVSGDLVTYDCGNFFLCTVEETGTTSIGKLWVEYDIEFFVPQNSASVSTTSSRTSLFTRTSNQTLSTGVGTPLQSFTLAYDPLGIGVDVAGVFTPPSGAYRIECFATFGDSANETFDVQMELLKNGASLSPGKCLVEFQISATANVTRTAAMQLRASSIVTCSGTDTFQLQCVATGAAGTLVAQGQSIVLMVSMA